MNTFLDRGFGERTGYAGFGAPPQERPNRLTRVLRSSLPHWHIHTMQARMHQHGARPRRCDTRVACEATNGHAAGPGSPGAPGMPSPDHRRDSLLQLIQTAADDRKEDVAVLYDDQELQVLLASKLTTQGVLMSITCEQLVAAGVTPGAAKVLKQLFPGPAQVGGMAVQVEAAGPYSMHDLWVHLRQLRATAGSLDEADYKGHKFEVISLGGDPMQFPGEGGVTHVLRRDCYRVAQQVMEDIWAEPGPNKPVVISGTPGTGQTVFLYDLMYEYALHDHPLLWHSWEEPDTLYCFGPDGDVRRGTWEAFKRELQDPDAIYLCDGVAPFKACAVVRPRTVITVSPNRLKETFFNNLIKTAAHLWLPVPSDEEMFAAAPLYDVDEVLCGQLMYRWGNVPRYVLPYAHNAQKQLLLYEAITRVSAESIEDAVRDYGRADPLTAMLLHVRAKPDLYRNGVGFASVWIQLKLYERLGNDATQRLVELCTGLRA